MKPIHFAALLLLGAIWGASFLFIGLAVTEFGPLALMFLRVLVAGLVLAVLAYLTQGKGKPEAALRLRANWRKYLTVGLLNSALPFTLIAFSELHLTVSLAAILNSTTPLFAALIAAAWSNEKLTGRKMGGVLLGVIGVTVLMGTGPLEVNSELIIAVAASLLAAFCYGAGTVYASKNLRGLPAIYASMAQLLGAAVILVPPAVLAMPRALPSSTALGAFLALTLLSSCFAYLLYFFLLQNVGPTRTASVTFLVPVFGTLWGVIFRQEPFNSGMIPGMVIILTSMGWVTGLQIGKRNWLMLRTSANNEKGDVGGRYSFEIDTELTYSNVTTQISGGASVTSPFRLRGRGYVGNIRRLSHEELLTSALSSSKEDRLNLENIKLFTLVLLP